MGSPCATCHADKARLQSISRHANALKPYDGAGFNGKTLRERGGTLYTYDANKVAITRDGVRREAVIQWLFGAGHFARTLLLRQDGRWVEHRISQYPLAGRLSLTPGHSPQPADSFDTAFGIVQSDSNAERCFACHSTSPAQPGIHCQRCHGEGEKHPAEPTITRTKDVVLRAECHRSPILEFASPGPKVEDPASKCYQASKGALTCVACHDPHTDARPAMTYDRKCLGCHTAAKKQDCSRTANCATCHMPRSRPIPLLTFTGHRIR